MRGLDYQWQVLMCAVVGVFMVMLDQTVVNIALPRITTVFGVGVHETQLVVTSYMLALAVIMPATGYLSDTFGTKRLYLITMALFTGGSLLCGLAWNNIVMPSGDIIPPPRPWITRKATRLGLFHARPHSSEPPVNRAIVIRYRRLTPNVSER